MTVALLWADTAPGVCWRLGGLAEANALLSVAHYLGPIQRARHVVVGVDGARLVAAQVWTLPTSRHLPADGTWLELARWCLTPAAGQNAGSRMHGWAVRWLRGHVSATTTLVSYSDPSQGHTGALYRACNWQWAPTWHRLRPPPSGNGSWDRLKVQAVKDRWVFPMRPDPSRAALVAVRDQAALRAWERKEQLA